MSDDQVTLLRDARKWFNDGQCCGQVDSAGICAAPACIFGEALKEFSQAADRIEKQAAEIARLRADLTTARLEGMEQLERYFRDAAAGTPLGYEDHQRGASVYNWLMYCATTIAAIRAVAKEGKL